MKNRKNMKQLKLILIIAITFLTIPCSAIITGMMIQETTTGDMTERDILNYAIDQQLYATGGITFTYPVGWFSAPPYVQVSVGQNEVHPTTETYVAEVSVNTSTGTTVMVYKVSSGVVTEAPDSTLIIYLLAAGQS
jgi:hypothetical protein